MRSIAAVMCCERCGRLMVFGYAEGPAGIHVSRRTLGATGYALNKHTVCDGRFVDVDRPEVAAAYLLGGDTAVDALNIEEEAAAQLLIAQE